MSLTLGIAVFVVIWWTVLFAVLPLGLRTQAESGDVVPGTPESAPAQPNMLRLFAINTCVAIVVFALVWMTIEYQWVTVDMLSFKSLGKPGG